MTGYRIFTDATADLTPELLEGLPEISIIPMTIEIGGQEFTYGPGGTITVKEFYDLQRKGLFANTSQINPEVYRRYFEPVLQEGLDILYLCFSSGLSGTIHSAQVYINELRDKYPERQIVCVDTLCASVGEGFLVMEAARKQAKGIKLDRLTNWIGEKKLNVCHWFTVDTFEHLKHGGRVGTVSAAMGTC